MVVARTLARAAWLDIVFRDPWSVSEDDYLMVLHAADDKLHSVVVQKGKRTATSRDGAISA